MYATFIHTSPSGGTTAYEGEQGTAPAQRRASRYVRPAQLPPLALQPRDRQLLAAVFEHRYLAADHVRLLLFPGRSRQVVQMRLRALWAHRYLDRHFIPYAPDGVHPAPETAGRPLYMLARRGAQVVAEDLGLNLAAIPHTPTGNARGFATLNHHLVVTDFLAALTAACRGEEAVELVGIDREHALRARLTDWQQVQLRCPFVPLPDGAFTLAYPAGGARTAFFLEVVRSDVKGGNRTLAERLAQYVTANRGGIFARVYGHERLRAVLILTTSEVRAEHFRALAAALPAGRGLFWFGTYEAPDERGRKASTLTPATILAPRWRTADGAAISLRPEASRANPSHHV